MKRASRVTSSGWRAPASTLFNLVRHLYSLGLYLSAPLALARLAYLGYWNRSYWQSVGQRFGFVAHRRSEGPLVWIHAVSVGEVQAARPIIERLQSDYSDLHVLVTTSTPTGVEMLRTGFGEKVTHSYLPFDLPDSVARFLGRIRPGLLVLMETELWPNLIHACAARKIPVVLANGRLSERSFVGYQRVIGVVRFALRQFVFLAVQSDVDAARFGKLGVDAGRIVVTGNTKFDVGVPDEVREDAQTLRREISDNWILLGASTHEGEEPILLQAFTQLRAREPRSLLVLVPRHPGRVDKIAELCRTCGFPSVIRSSEIACDEHTAVYLVDTIGELLKFYGAADVAFVGGSLVEHGGHNVLEPASMGVPVLTGPYVDNFAEISAQLTAAGALRVVHDADELVAAWSGLLVDGEERAKVGVKGQRFVEANRGAVDKVMGLLTPYLSELCQRLHS